MGRSSVRPVVRGFIAERYVQSLFTGTSQICPGPGVRRTQHNDFIMTGTLMPEPYGPAFCSANGGSLAASAGDLFYAPLRQERH